MVKRKKKRNEIIEYNKTQKFIIDFLNLNLHIKVYYYGIQLEQEKHVQQ